MKPGGSHNGAKSRHRSESVPEICTTEIWCGKSSPCVCIRQNQTCDMPYEQEYGSDVLVFQPHVYVKTLL